MELDAWHDLFVAAAGAAAALAGLIIVAMSVNIKEIIAIRSMPSRAGASIASLLLIVVVSIAALIPEQPAWVLGLETLVASLIVLFFTADAMMRMIGERRASKPGDARRPIWGIALNALLGALQVLPFTIGGICLVAGAGVGVGLAWIAAGILFVFIGAVLNAWVMLVEILR
ncbi:hypothetical protein BH09ACT6_BH09ACT6_10680 [soil metagenome]